MTVGIFAKRIVPFCLAVAVGAVGVYLQRSTSQDLWPSTQHVVQPSVADSGYGGTGCGECPNAGRSNDLYPSVSARRETGPIQFLDKPRALYTDAARDNYVEGSVRLRVTLLASGEVGSITVVSGLPDGLTENAIEAARKLKFRPATVDGVPVSKSVTIDYSFTLY